MPLIPPVLNTDRLMDTDMRIRSLAAAVNDALGAGYALATSVGTYTVDGAGRIKVLFPLGLVAGAIILPAGSRQYAWGQPRTYIDPIPPATIGLMIGQTPIQIFPLTFAAGEVTASVRTTAWSAATVRGVKPFWGSQLAKSGTVVPVSAIAWGASS